MGSCSYILVEQDLPGLVEHAEVHRFGVQVDAAEVVLFGLDVIESHGSPPGVCFVDPNPYKVGFGRRP